MRFLVVLMVVVASISAATIDKCTRHPNTKLGQEEAVSRLKAVGIHVPQKPGCSSKPTLPCISLSGIRCVAVTSAIAVKKGSGCKLTIAGGTEGGHSGSGPYSHANGYKLDFNKTECLTSYIHATFTKFDKRHWRSADGDVYYNLFTIWDVSYHHSPAN